MTRRSPLHGSHVSLGAKFVPFGGWEMPLSYPSGTLSEHEACRQSAAMFDVSHLGTVECSGPDAFERLQSTLTNNLGRISVGRAQYTHLLDPIDGSVADDIIVWWIDEQRFHVMPNASNTERVLEAVGGVDITDGRAVMAVQGPQARAIVSTLWPEAAQVGRFGVRVVNCQGVDCVVAGTGYTGEDGLELAVPAAEAPVLWEALLGAGVEPAGLGARDTLRLEAGLPLHGHEIGPGITPLQANLEWVVDWGKETFLGREALLREKQQGPKRGLCGLMVPGRRPVRQGCVVSDVTGRRLGEVTSGNYSPTLGHCVAMALLEGSPVIGDQVSIDLRGTPIEASIVSLPFIAPKKH